MGLQREKGHIELQFTTQHQPHSFKNILRTYLCVKV